MERQTIIKCKQKNPHQSGGPSHPHIHHELFQAPRFPMSRAKCYGEQFLVGVERRCEENGLGLLENNVYQESGRRNGIQGLKGI